MSNYLKLEDSHGVMRQKKIFDIQFFFSVFLSLFVFEFSTPILVSRMESNGNITIYATMLFVTFISFVIFLFFAKFFARTFIAQKLYVALGKVVFFITTTCVFVCLFRYFKKGLSFYGWEAWNIFPKWVSFVAIAIFFIIVLTKILYDSNNKKIQSIILYVFAALLYAFSKYNPNIMFADAYDSDAWCGSIFNVVDNIPFNLNTTGIYGHYALFFKLPLLLFGSSFFVISKLIAIISFISMLLLCYCSHKMIKNTTIRFLVIGTALLEPLYILPYSYYSTSPGRYFFPMILLAYLASHKTRRLALKNIIIGIVICACAICWNLESGIACALAFHCYVFFVKWKDSVKAKRNFVLNGLFFLFMPPLELFFAIGIVNFYNFSVGGGFIFSTFFYPFNHHLSAFSLVLKKGNFSYIYIIPFAFCAIYYGVYKMIKKAHTTTSAFVVAVSIIIFTLYSYYMNRFVSCNVFVIVWELAILLGIFVDKYIFFVRYFVRTNRKLNCLQGAKLSLAIISLLFLCSMTLGNLFSPTKQLELYSSGKYNTSLLKRWCKEVASKVPKDTFAVGIGTKVLYSVLGWNSGVFYDWPNIIARPDVVELLRGQINGQQRLFIDSSVLDTSYGFGRQYLSLDDFPFQHTFCFGNRIYYYLSKSYFLVNEKGISFFGDDYNADIYVLKGLSGKEQAFSWTDGHQLALSFQFSKEYSGRLVSCVFTLADVFNGSQNIKCSINDKEVFQKKLTTESGFSFDFVVPYDGITKLIIDLPNAISPKDIGMSEDVRMLALALQRISFIKKELYE